MGRVVLITGSSSGIGAGLALRLASLGYTPVLTYHTHKKDAQAIAAQIKHEYGIDPIVMKLDVTNAKDLTRLANEIKKQYGKLDTLICNAGVDYLHQSFNDILLSEWHEVYGVKVFGTFSTIQTMLPLLAKSNDAHVIVVSASLADKADPLDPVYSSACAALNNLARSLVYSLGPSGVRTNIVSPGPQDTNLQYWQDIKLDSPEIFESIKSQNPRKERVSINQIADAIHSLDENTALNGNTLYITAGSHLR